MDNIAFIISYMKTIIIVRHNCFLILIGNGVF